MEQGGVCLKETGHYGYVSEESVLCLVLREHLSASLPPSAPAMMLQTCFKSPEGTVSNRIFPPLNCLGWGFSAILTMADLTQ